MHWIAHVFGFANGEGNDSPYLFWSGIFGDGPVLAAVLIFGWHHQCAEDGCRRIGKAHQDHRCNKHANVRSQQKAQAAPSSSGLG